MNDQQKWSGEGEPSALLGCVLTALVLVGLMVFAFRCSPSRAPVDEAGEGSEAGYDVAPVEESASFHGCPSSGNGGDVSLNRLKNRSDTGTFVSVPLGQLLTLTWPKGVSGEPMRAWSARDLADVRRVGGKPVQSEGYLAGVKLEGPEKTNCDLPGEADRDIHLWLVILPSSGRDKSMVIEITPRVRAIHPSWTLTSLSRVAAAGQKVRVSGWTMLDPDHPEQLGKTRATLWEIHPVILLDVMQSDGTWLPLDVHALGSGQE